VTLGLCSQRELDALVAKAAKKAGIDNTAVDDTRLGSDREALIEELRAERTEAARKAEALLNGEEEVADKIELTADTLFKKSGE
jgi:uncharacterized protein